MSILRMFSCCIKRIDTSNYESATDLQIQNNDVLTSSVTIGNLTFNYTANGIDTQRIETIFKNINNFNCGKKQLHQLKEALNDGTIHFEKGTEYMCDVEDGINGKKTVVFTLPEDPKSELIVPYVTLQKNGLAIIPTTDELKIEYKKAPEPNVENDFKVLVFGSKNPRPEIKRITYRYKSPEEIEAYSMGHEIFHAISGLKNTETFYENPFDSFNEIVQKYMKDNSVDPFFTIGQLDDMNNLFGFETLENGERVICEYDYIKEFANTQDNIVRFPYDLSHTFSWFKNDEDLEFFKFIYVERMKKQPFTKNLNSMAKEAWENDRAEFQDTTKAANKVLSFVKQYHENDKTNQNDVMQVFNNGTL